MNAIRRKARGTPHPVTQTSNPSSSSSTHVPPQHPLSRSQYPQPHPQPHPSSHPSSPSPSPAPAPSVDRRASHPHTHPPTPSIATVTATATASNLADRYGSFDGYGSFFPPASTPQPPTAAVLPEIQIPFSSLAISAPGSNPGSGAATPPQAHSPSHHAHHLHAPQHTQYHHHRHAASISSFAALDGYTQHKEKVMVSVRDVRLLIVVSANDLVASIVNETAYQYSTLFPNPRNTPIDVSSCLVVDDHGTYIPLVYAVSDVVSFYSSQQVYPSDSSRMSSSGVSPLIPYFRLIENVVSDDVEEKYVASPSQSQSQCQSQSQSESQPPSQSQSRSQSQSQSRPRTRSEPLREDDDSSRGPWLHDETEEEESLPHETYDGPGSGAISRRGSQITVTTQEAADPSIPSLQSPSSARPATLIRPPNASFTLATHPDREGEESMHK